MRLSTVLLAALLPACGFSSNSDSGGGDGGGGGSDGHLPPDATQCFGSYVKVCFDTAADIPTTTLTLTSDIDTGTSQLCNTRNDRADKACVVAAAGLTVPAGTTIRGTGPRPLILLSTTTVDLSGTVDVSSSHLGTTGAGAATLADCAGTTAASNNSGGFGGSFGGKGGEGAAVDVSGQNPKGGLPALALTTFPTKLRGGCPGGAGSSTEPVGVTPAAGGAGGGAVLIIAQSIQITGRINASGAGGTGGPAGKAGGGGGGAGGTIFLEAASLTGNGVLFANGGGGGQGGTGTGGGGVGSGAGDPGQESSGPAVIAQGGQNATRGGGKGGAGSAGITNDGDSGLVPANSQAGGGGGGGGAGFIHAPGLTPVNIAPASKDL